MKEKLLKEELITVNMPKKIIIGDPSYYEDETLSKYKLDRLTYTKTFRGKLDWKCHVILKQTYTEDENIQYKTNSINLVCSADDELIELVKKDCCYNYIKVKDRYIGVDTAEYFFAIDNNDTMIQTGSDGYIATILEFYKGNKLLAIKINLDFGDVLDYEECKSRVQYLFNKNFE
ncbi:hypothetical protein HMPREF1092_03219 [Clostridium thermobutyricum]|uniref:Uncharacterized protein n=1 Tax=Clostridium thermobutyricum TaxID=29372 RepID=N9XU30_9CLOT|nr:hypothetical protein [Clostridium thermobutyricum]ENY99478.1 hypothetical protein HMPREF1092_03219 [Clostridium thermobutyricum]